MGEPGHRGEAQRLREVVRDLEADIVDVGGARFREDRIVEVAAAVVEIEAEARAADVVQRRRIVREGVGQKRPRLGHLARLEEQLAAQIVETVVVKSS